LAWGPLALAAAGSLLTAAYMLRWWLRLFTGGERDHEAVHHAHDPSGAAKWVLIAMAPFTIVVPWTAGDWLNTALRMPVNEEIHHAHGSATLLAEALFAAGGAFALLVFWLAPRQRRDLAGALAKAFAPLHAFCSELWFVDRLWDLVFTRGLGRGLAAVTARLDLGSAERLAGLESGEAARLQDAASLHGPGRGLRRPLLAFRR